MSSNTRGGIKPLEENVNKYKDPEPQSGHNFPANSQFYCGQLKAHE